MKNYLQREIFGAIRLHNKQRKSVQTEQTRLTVET